MWELDCEEGWAPKNWHFWTVVLEKTLESPLDCKEIQPVHSEDQPWDFFGRNDAKAEMPVLWPPHEKSWLIGKDFDAGRDWGQKEKGTTGWDGWMASLTRWMLIWVNSGSWWWTGRPGVLQFMRSQRVGHDWATELNMLPMFVCCAHWLSHVRFFVTPWTFAWQAPLFMGVLQARILEWVAMPSSKGSSQRVLDRLSHAVWFMVRLWIRVSQLALVVKNSHANTGDVRGTGLIPG